jgi:3-isopropylmalate/(R)-2-methylmalate dehydratase small subunit
MIINASVRTFGDDIDTDVIIPARYLSSRDPIELGRHCMEPLDPEFPKRVRPGDVLVAGRNFGCGSSREHAVLALKGVGVSCVIARGFARIFFRNALNQGLPVLTCPEAVDAAREGAPIKVDLAAGEIELDGKRFRAQPLPDFLRQVVASGGLTPYVRQRLAERRGGGASSAAE